MGWRGRDPQSGTGLRPRRCPCRRRSSPPSWTASRTCAA